MSPPALTWRHRACRPTRRALSCAADTCLSRLRPDVSPPGHVAPPLTTTIAGAVARPAGREAIVAIRRRTAALSACLMVTGVVAPALVQAHAASAETVQMPVYLVTHEGLDQDQAA